MRGRRGWLAPPLPCFFLDGISQCLMTEARAVFEIHRREAHDCDKSVLCYTCHCSSRCPTVTYEKTVIGPTSLLRPPWSSLSKIRPPGVSKTRMTSRARLPLWRSTKVGLHVKESLLDLWWYVELA